MSARPLPTNPTKPFPTRLAHPTTLTDPTRRWPYDSSGPLSPGRTTNLPSPCLARASDLSHRLASRRSTDSANSNPNDGPSQLGPSDGFSQPEPRDITGLTAPLPATSQLDSALPERHAKPSLVTGPHIGRASRQANSGHTVSTDRSRPHPAPTLRRIDACHVSTRPAHPTTRCRVDPGLHDESGQAKSCDGLRQLSAHLSSAPLCWSVATKPTRARPTCPAHHYPLDGADRPEPFHPTFRFESFRPTFHPPPTRPALATCHIGSARITRRDQPTRAVPPDLPSQTDLPRPHRQTRSLS